MQVDEARYDRQLRLWGAHGQRQLSHTKVVCFGSSSIATETLKNLVLPGIGSFLVVDDARVTERDLNSNFFLEKSDLGKFRAEATVERLIELNPSLTGQGSAVTNLSDLFHVTSILSPGEKLVTVLTNGWTRDIRAIQFVKMFPGYTVNVESIGFVGRVALFGKHIALEPKSEEGSIVDLMMRCPWPELQAYIDSFDFSDRAHMHKFFHIPWLVILAKAYQTGARTRAEMLESIKGLEEGVIDGLNFQEARDNIFMITALRDDDEILETLQLNLQKLEEEFDLEDRPEDREACMVAEAITALIDFYKSYHRFPLSTTSPPDMTSDTQSYTRLVEIFNRKFEEDAKMVLGNRVIDESILHRVIRNFRDIQIMKFPDAFETADEAVVSPTPKRRSMDDEFPSQFDDMDQYTLVQLLDRKYVDEAHPFKKEFDRYKNDMELHAVSSVVGAVAAQEIVKLVTNQFVPIDNAFVFNGTNGSAFTYRK
jgi:amyloid beta precursor protein binding protein 1